MKENDFILLLYKRLNGEISPSEDIALDEWIRQSSDNARLVREYSLVWEKSGTYNKQFSPDLDRDFASVQARIRALDRPAMKVVSFNRALLRAAAAVALLAIAVWGYTRFGSSTYFDAVAS